MRALTTKIETRLTVLIEYRPSTGSAAATMVLRRVAGMVGKAVARMLSVSIPYLR